MKNLIDYIIEGLKITSQSKVNQKDKKTEALKNIDTSNVSRSIRMSYRTPAQEETHYNKMEAYKSKGSNPQRLLNSIKDEHKLVMRWKVAISIDWIECAVAFRDEIVKRGYFSEDELDAWALNQYNRYSKSSSNPYVDKIKKYLDAIGVDYYG